tara:strand:+ start:379 stop:666 length:288 start_codon:yes stop_codon:yes gene_type:complete
MGNSKTPLPPALPPDVTKQIWQEVLPNDMPKVILDRILDKTVIPTDAYIESFVQGAMEYPHFATSPEIAKALGMDATRANWIVRKIRRAARENRR